jgi:integrase/recombinase XerD
VPVHGNPSHRARDFDIAALLDSWLLALRAEHKSPTTISSYRRGVQQYLAYCGANNCSPVLDRHTVSAFTAHLLDTGAAPTTARLRQLALRRFSAWLLEEGETVRDELLRLRAPKLDQKVIEPLSDEQIKKMIAVSTHADMYSRRDEAIIRLMVEAGVRAGEVVAMMVPDLDLKAGTAIIRRGKGARGRVVPFSPQTVRAIDRYLRLRRGHKLASSPILWLGDHGLKFGYSALWKSLGLRASLAGVENFHPHRLRHTAAHRWLAAGGSEGGLMAIAGWSNAAMLQRYSRARASERAAEEARRLNLGDI